ncbi:hypothetical protein RUM44_005674 [Polyplax serrata]|uniref:Small ribosomal subunit protein mS29 n=1 Tax=Polyplax serrata TaxID=468196 RepID=A0ABR1AW92_POLSC
MRSLRKNSSQNVGFLDEQLLIQHRAPVRSILQLMFTFDTTQVHHTKNDVGLFYTPSKELWFDVLFKGLFKYNYREECTTFQEVPVLIREPALEIMNYLKNADYSAPINKYLLLKPWICTKDEIVESTTKEGNFDIPNVGSRWLQLFKNQNENVIKNLDLKIENTYKWNIKEETRKGESLLSLINHGITRLRYSCDVIDALTTEIKLLSTSGRCKTLVAINNYSLLFRSKTLLKNADKKYIEPDQITALAAFKNMTKADWHNAAAVLVSSVIKLDYDRMNFLPMSQLGRDGFEFLSPFIPVEVPALTEKEFVSILAYYKSKKWLRHSDGDAELKFLCGGSPLTLRQLCSPI